MKKILIVDDKKKVRGIYRKYLDKKGFDVREASNANEAEEILLKENIFIILLDIDMPDVTGDFFYKVIKLFHKNTRVIVSSVLPVSLQMDKIEGAFDYFDKSEGLNKLLEKVDKVLNEDIISVKD